MGRRRGTIVGLILVVALGAGLAAWRFHGGKTVVAFGPEGVALQNAPDLAPASTTASGGLIDGITCRPTMQQAVAHHIHALVRIFVDGRPDRLPAGAGVAARFPEHLSTGLFVDSSVDGCLYWLHTHSNDGIVHIESPSKATFTLGQFFDIWGQPLSSTQVGTARGKVVAFENGKRFSDPRSMPLLSQAVIQLDIGEPVVPFQSETFKVNGLCSSGSSCSSQG